MKQFNTSDTKFVFSKNELGYAEVLDAMPDASEITIVTYNISQKREELLNALKSAGEECKINVVTNIPNRWEMYYGDEFRKKAKQQINLYMTRLSPDKLGHLSSVYFDFSNHGKIIMTDSIAYIGSANYSEESAKNSEFGFISKDPALIRFIKDEVLPDIQAESIPYYKYDYTALLLEANMALSSVFNIRNRLHEEIYMLHDDIDGEWFYYDDNSADLSIETLELIERLLENSLKIAGELVNAVDTITNGNEDEVTVANDVYEKLSDISKKCEELKNSDAVYDFAVFNPQSYIDEQLQSEYAMEAYEENLENCIGRASENAVDLTNQLAQDAQEDLDALLNQLKLFENCYGELIENVKNRGIRKISSNIDNT